MSARLSEPLVDPKVGGGPVLLPISRRWRLRQKPRTTLFRVCVKSLRPRLLAVVRDSPWHRSGQAGRHSFQPHPCCRQGWRLSDPEP